MIILALIILILYYYFFVIFDEDKKKPQNISKPVINLNNEVLNGNAVVLTLKPGEFYEYDTGLIKGPYEFIFITTKVKIN